jgi:hypothetical protein
MGRKCPKMAFFHAKTPKKYLSGQFFSENYFFEVHNKFVISEKIIFGQKSQIPLYTRHLDVKFFFLRELKEKGLLVIKHVPGNENDADIFTKNVTASIFKKHLPLYVGKDEYMKS